MEEEKKNEKKFLKREDTYSYRGWLVSDFIWKRSLAVLGHYALATIFLYVVVVAILAILALVFITFGSFFEPHHFMMYR